MRKKFEDNSYIEIRKNDKGGVDIILASIDGGKIKINSCDIEMDEFKDMVKEIF